MYIKIIFLSLAFFCTNSIYAQVNCNQGNQDPNNNPNQETIDSNPSAKSEATAVQPVDPNEIVGTDGWMVVDSWGDTVRWVSASQSLPYTVYFENDPLMATAAAQVVTVRLRLHPLMNIADFRIGTFGFGNMVFPVEGSPLQYQTRLDLVDEMNLFVDVVAGIDITRNEAFWIFSSIDPITGIAPTESNRGFLAINDSTHIGEGFVTFSIKPSANRCHTGDTIGMQASIIFDVNEAIETNRWVNTIDAEAPVSNCTVIANEMPAYQDSIYITFSGEDDATGMAAYRLYYTENGSAFRLAGRYLAGDTAVFASQPNTTYSFFSLGEDMVSNIEPMKGEADTLFGNTSVQLLASVRPEGAGIITGTSSYILGDTANLFVQPAVGYRLLRWSEGGVPQGTDTLLTLVADQNHNLTAEMARLSYPLTVEAAEETNITVTTRTPTGNQPSYQEVRHFDTLDIHISASPCYDNVSFYLNGFPLTSDTMLVVHETVSLSSVATQQIDTGYVYDTVCRNFSYSANGYNILSSATNTSGIAIFQRSVINSSGCDSVSQLILYVKPSHTLTFVANGGEGTMPTQQICDGEESVLNSSNFTREGYFFAGWATSAGATTAQYADGGIITLTGNQTLYAVWSSNCVNRECNYVVTVCDSYMWNGELKTESGDYLRTVSSAVPGGCDSIYRLRLTVKHSSENLQQVVSCHPFTWIDGLTYYSDTTRQLSMANTVGCDSLITLQLVVTDNIYATESVTACNSYLWHGEVYTASTNLPTYTTQNADGCDSVVTLHLTINHCSTTEITACDSYTWHGTTFTTSGVYADGTDTLILTINHSTTGVDALTACDSITWHGNLYINGGNGIATYTTTNAAGCDSVTTLNLTVRHSSSSIETATACDSYTWNGTEYTASGMSTYQTVNSVGCDSVATLYLTINNSSTGTDVVAACDSYIWIDGITYTASTSTPTFTTQNAMGCDSVITLQLTILESLTSTETVTACDSFAWHGTTYTISTSTPTFTTTSTEGCDSTVTLNLTINYSTTATETATACDSYTWNGTEYTVSGTPTYQTINSVGCDSVATLYLTINYSVDTIITDTAVGSYTWNGTTYTESGSYQWQGTTINGCDSTVTLMLVVNSVGIEMVDGEGISVKVYPNPTTGWITIDADDVLSVEVFDQAGRHIATHDNTNRIDLGGLATGNYMLRIHLQRGNSIQRVILK